MNGNMYYMGYGIVYGNMNEWKIHLILRSYGFSTLFHIVALHSSVCWLCVCVYFPLVKSLHLFIMDFALILHIFCVQYASFLFDINK